MSVGDQYFGEEYRTYLLKFGFTDGKIYGCVDTVEKESSVLNPLGH